MPISCHFLPTFGTVITAGGSSDIGKSFIELGGNLHPKPSFFNLTRRNPGQPLAQLKLRRTAGGPRRPAHLEQPPEQVLGLIRNKVQPGRRRPDRSNGNGSGGRFGAHCPARADLP
jgi:hypothetical protein